MRFDYNLRIEKLSPLADAIALIGGANMTYYTGVHMHLSERPTILLLGKTGRAVIVPALEVPVWEKTCQELDITAFAWSDATGYEDAFKQAIAFLKLDQPDTVLGVDGQSMRVFEYLALERSGVHQLSDVGQALLNIRSLKTAEEVEAIRQAIAISEKSLVQLIEQVEAGITEKQIANELERLMTENGMSSLSFGTLVQTGENSAVPHGSVSDRVLRDGEFLLIDFGARFGEYPADITRTFCLGKPTEEMQRIYDTVLAANKAGIAACRPGAKAGDVDRATREVIEQAGYGEYFTHRTGHGLGLEVHELPNISPNNDIVLVEGMVFTIEPGIYVPNVGGVRIEDNVYITADGAEVLTSYPKETLA